MNVFVRIPKFPTTRTASLTLALVLLCATTARATGPALNGALPPEVRSAFDAGLLALPPSAQGLPTASATGEWVIPIIRVAFTDSALIHPASALEQSLFDTTGSQPDGSMTDYWLWASGGRLRVRGEVVATIQLEHDRYYYSFDGYGLTSIATPNNSAGLARDAARLADPLVDWTRFDRDRDGFVDMLWIVHAGPGAETNGVRRNLWSITSMLSSGWSNSGVHVTQDLLQGSVNQYMRVDRFTILPELSGVRPGELAEIGIFCHEFGHALGLPDLYDTSSLGGAANSGPGVWSLMSTGTYGADGRSPQRPTNLGAWPQIFLGWADRVRPVQDSTVTLRPIAEGGPVLELWCNGENGPEHFLLEQRSRLGFDRDLPGEGVLAYQIDEAVLGSRLPSNRVNIGLFPALRVLEGDGDQDLMRGFNRGDSGDPLPGSSGVTLLDDETTPGLRSLSGSPTNLALRDLTPVPGGTRLRLEVRARGWSAPAALVAQPQPVQLASGPGLRAVRADDGREHLVTAEVHEGHTRIAWRERSGEDWSPALLLDDGLAPVGEPTLSALPGGDLAVAWTSGSTGATRIAVRTWVQGVWSAVHWLSPATHVAIAPSLASDPFGRVSLAWLGREPGQPERVWLARFFYASPFAQPWPVSAIGQLPGAPLVVADPLGPAWVLWSERSVFPIALHFVRAHPDSAPAPPLRLANTNGFPQLSFGATIAADGSLHTLWQATGTGVSEIHWQRRLRSGALSPRDSTLDVTGEGLRDPMLASDPDGNVHAAWLRAQPWGAQMRYTRWRTNRGWDYRTTPLTDERTGPIERAGLLPSGPDDVSAIVLAEQGGVWLPFAAERRSDAPLTSAPHSGARTSPGWRVWPNPLRAGTALALAASSPDATVDVFDALGRRVARGRAGADGVVRFTSDLTRTWGAGLYFARSAGTPGHARLVVVR